MPFTPDPALAARVFPPGHRNPEPAARYDLVVIGAGTAGLVCAAGAAGLGAKVALVERRALGGDCLNVGCVPSKALIRAATAAHAVRNASGFGVHAHIDRIDFGEVMARVRSVRLAISPHDSVARFASLGVDVFLGECRFAGRRAATVGGATLRFRRAVIATGGRPALPDIPGLADASPLSNESVFELGDQPRRLLVLGGGPVGCELAQAFQRLGTEVTLVQSGETLLTRESGHAAAIVRAALEADGARVYPSSRVSRVEPGQPHRVHLETPVRSLVVDVDRILVGTGRLANIETLALHEAGVAASRTGVTVDRYLRTSNPAIYAAGDVCLPQHFTHAADASARAALQNALFLGRKRVPATSIPRCTYTDPEVAHVGEGPDGDGVATFSVEWADVDRARIDGDTVGGVHVYARAGRIVGGSVIGRLAGDLIGELAVLAARRVRLSELAGIVHPYPTHAEAIRRTGDIYNRTRLTPLARTFAERFLAWRR